MIYSSPFPDVRIPEVPLVEFVFTNAAARTNKLALIDGVTGRAVTDGRVLKFPVSRFPELVQRMPELTTRLVGVMSDRIRELTRFEQQRDRLRRPPSHVPRLSREARATRSRKGTNTSRSRVNTAR